MAGNHNSGRSRKPVWQHELHGTYRADRHGPRELNQMTRPPSSDNGRESEGDMSRNRGDGEIEVFKGVDVLPDERLLVTASTLEWTLDASAKTIHRWAEQGLMPKPYAIGKSKRWNAEEIRSWISDGCPGLDTET